jgi:hypothetical protein
MGRCESTSSLSFSHSVDGVASVDVFSIDAAGWQCGRQRESRDVDVGP